MPPDIDTPKPYTDDQRRLFKLVRDINRTRPDFDDADQWILSPNEPTAFEESQWDREQLRAETRARRRRTRRIRLTDDFGSRIALFSGKDPSSGIVPHHDALWERWWDQYKAWPFDVGVQQHVANRRISRAESIRCLRETWARSVSNEQPYGPLPRPIALVLDRASIVRGRGENGESVEAHGPKRLNELFGGKAEYLLEHVPNFDKLDRSNIPIWARRVLRIVWMMTDTGDLNGIFESWRWGGPFPGEYELSFLMRMLEAHNDQQYRTRAQVSEAYLDPNLSKWEEMTRLALLALEDVEPGSTKPPIGPAMNEFQEGNPSIVATTGAPMTIHQALNRLPLPDHQRVIVAWVSKIYLAAPDAFAAAAKWLNEDIANDNMPWLKVHDMFRHLTYANWPSGPEAHLHARKLLYTVMVALYPLPMAQHGGYGTRPWNSYVSNGPSTSTHIGREYILFTRYTDDSPLVIKDSSDRELITGFMAEVEKAGKLVESVVAEGCRVERAGEPKLAIPGNTDCKDAAAAGVNDQGAQAGCNGESLRTPNDVHLTPDLVALRENEKPVDSTTHGASASTSSVVSPGSSPANQPLAIPDGPIAPKSFWWKGEEHLLEPTPYLLLEYLWKHRRERIERLEQHVWGDEAQTESRFKAAQFKVNDLLFLAGVGLTIRKCKGWVMLEN